MRGAPARRHPASEQQPGGRSRTTRTRGSASSRSTSSTPTASRSGSRAAGFPAPQGEYYTGVGHKNVGSLAREIVEAHLDLCLEAGINHEGINAEVAKGQWEFQIFGKGSKRAADEMWIARYLLLRLCERYGVDVNWHCKPLGVEVDWNGSGMHTNFSTKYMREVGGEEYFHALMAAFEEHMADHIEVYGPDNHLRLTGLHETQSIDTFSWGVADRGASIRVPHSFVNNDYKGYLEDRRPNSQGDPYRIAGRIIESIEAVPLPGKSLAELRRETARRIVRTGRWSSASRWAEAGGLTSSRGEAEHATARPHAREPTDRAQSSSAGRSSSAVSSPPCRAARR